MAVTQGLGDGYALYNGVKLPNIESVWKDKVKYPYAVIAKIDYSQYGVDASLFSLYLASLPLLYDKVNDSVVWTRDTDGDGRYTESELALVLKYGSGSLFPEQKDIDNLAAAMGESADGLSPGVWLDFSYSEVADAHTHELFFRGSAIWTSHDILNTDGTLYLAATTPIPLDGMQVIEWDGDTTDLVSTGGTFYKMSDEVFKPNQTFSYIYVLSGQAVGGTAENLTDYPDAGMLTEMNSAFTSAYSTAYASETGLYFGANTTLLAYTPPAAEPEQPKWQFNLQDFLSGMAAAAASRGVLRRTNGAQIPNNSKGTTLISVGTPITALLSYMMGYQIGCILRAQRVKQDSTVQALWRTEYYIL